MKNHEIYPGYTPYGYIQNPYYQCKEGFRDTTGALLRTDDNIAGFGCFFPDIKHFNRLITLGLGAVWKGAHFFSRNDWNQKGYYSGHHSAKVFSYCFSFNDCQIEITYYQKDKHRVGINVSIPEAIHKKNDLTLFWLLHLQYDEPYCLNIANSIDNEVISGEFAHTQMERLTAFQVKLDGLRENGKRFLSNNLHSIFQKKAQYQNPSSKELFIAKQISLLQTKLTGEILFEDSQEAFNKYPTERNVNELEEVLAKKLYDDLVFQSKMPHLTGDWDPSILNGWVYDFETTRMCVFPAMGVFKDVWPSWMITYPRAVLAEGAMDMNRMGYADPDLAKRAILSLFRDTGAENVPCVFYTGVPNMIAEDGSICGTSPAWCLPFYQIFQLYLRDPDKDWLKALFPYMKAYHQWWEKHRSDEDGFIVYRCTWEAGEDDSPRLDPKRTGDNVISDYIRPDELQASMAVNAHIMKFFSQELSSIDDAFYWENQKAFFIEKLQSLWDGKNKRYRDWNKEKDDWLEVKGQKNYWNADFTRLSPLSLISVLFDLSEKDQKEAMRKEIPLFGCEPFNVWPSWNYILSEAAAALHMNAFLSEFSWEIIERVYGENDSRVLTPGKSLPGGAREYWPLERDRFKGNDVYAWGAQTALLLIQNIIGIRSSQNTNEISSLLCPNIPEKLLVKGKKYGIENFNYRGIRFDLQYEIFSQQMLKVVINTKKTCKVQIFVNEKQLFESELSKEHVFLLKNSSEYELKMIFH